MVLDRRVLSGKSHDRAGQHGSKRQRQDQPLHGFAPLLRCFDQRAAQRV